MNSERFYTYNLLTIYWYVWVSNTYCIKRKIYIFIVSRKSDQYIFYYFQNINVCVLLNIHHNIMVHFNTYCMNVDTSFFILKMASPITMNQFVYYRSTHSPISKSYIWFIHSIRKFPRCTYKLCKTPTARKRNKKKHNFSSVFPGCAFSVCSVDWPGQKY